MLLQPRHRAMLDELLARFLPAGVTVWAYGSRVNGQAHEASDLDLVLRCPGLQPLPASRLAALRYALVESNIPIIVDLHDWTALPASFHAQIERQYEELRFREAAVPAASQPLES